MYTSTFATSLAAPAPIQTPKNVSQTSPEKLRAAPHTFIPVRPRRKQHPVAPPRHSFRKLGVLVQRSNDKLVRRRERDRSLVEVVEGFAECLLLMELIVREEGREVGRQLVREELEV